MTYGVYRIGGSIGENSNNSVAEFKGPNAKAEAKAKAASLRKGLSKGERSYYKMSYTFKEIK